MVVTVKSCPDPYRRRLSDMPLPLSHRHMSTRALFGDIIVDCVSEYDDGILQFLYTTQVVPEELNRTGLLRLLRSQLSSTINDPVVVEEVQPAALNVPWSGLTVLYQYNETLTTLTVVPVPPPVMVTLLRTVTESKVTKQVVPLDPIVKLQLSALDKVVDTEPKASVTLPLPLPQLKFIPLKYGYELLVPAGGLTVRLLVPVVEIDAPVFMFDGPGDATVWSMQ